MPTFEEARKTILDSVAPLGIERVMLLDAPGRVLAEDIAAPWDMPLWDNSAMDGYAVRSADCGETGNPAGHRVHPGGRACRGLPSNRGPP